MSEILIGVVLFMYKEPKEAADRNESDGIIGTGECLLVSEKEIQLRITCHVI